MMYKQFSAAFLLACLSLLFTTLVRADTASQAGEEGAEGREAAMQAVMKSKLEDILVAVNQVGDNADDKLRGAIDFPTITRGVLGKHRNSASAAQQQRFEGEFQKSMTNLLRAAIESAGDYSVEVTRSKLSPKNPERGQAYAQVNLSDGQVIELVSSVAVVDGEWKVRNLIFSGVNLGKTYRSQFDELVQQNNGDLDLAIDAWAARAAPEE